MIKKKKVKEFMIVSQFYRKHLKVSFGPEKNKFVRPQERIDDARITVNQEGKRKQNTTGLTKWQQPVEAF